MEKISYMNKINVEAWVILCEQEVLIFIDTAKWN